jgi:hypothetical protein
MVNDEGREDEVQDAAEGGSLKVQLANDEGDERELHENEEEPRLGRTGTLRDGACRRRALGPLPLGYTKMEYARSTPMNHLIRSTIRSVRARASDTGRSQWPN